MVANWVCIPPMAKLGKTCIRQGGIADLAQRRDAHLAHEPNVRRSGLRILPTKGKIDEKLAIALDSQHLEGNPERARGAVQLDRDGDTRRVKPADARHLERDRRR